MKEFFVKKFESGNEILLAVCDSGIVGKTFEGKTARITVSEYFYKGEECSESELLGEMKASTIINLAGNKCVEVAAKAGIINRKNILVIGDIMHAQSVTAKYSNIE